MGKGLAVLGALLIALSVAAFSFVDPILGAFPAIAGITVLAIAWLARDWDQHPSFQEREAARARKRAAKYDRAAGARAKDRARWEAYQAKKANKAAEQ